MTEYADEGVSGAKGRDRRPQLDAMLRDAVRRRFDVVMVWAVARSSTTETGPLTFPVGAWVV